MKNKYRNTETTIDGIKFKSKAEARRYTELKLELEQGKIRNLKLQPEYHVQEGYVDPSNGQRVKPIKYIADFSYERMMTTAPYLRQWVRIVEDVKGVQTPVFKLKYQMMIERFGIWVDIIK